MSTYKRTQLTAGAQSLGNAGVIAKAGSRYICRDNAGSMFKHNRFNVKLKRRVYVSSSMTDIVFQLFLFRLCI